MYYNTCIMPYKQPYNMTVVQQLQFILIITFRAQCIITPDEACIYNVP